MTTVTPSTRFVMGNDLAELRRMTQWVQESAGAAGIAPEVVRILDHCANEAVVNIISYAYEDAKRHDIVLELNKTAHGAGLVIRDDGKPFNMLEAPEHRPAENLAGAQIGGLGIHLIRRMAARCDYRREGGFNVLSLEAQPNPQHCNA
ncbi:MAG: ATP-binding protein [Proteobacteria bacterium]|nr:ATP-binding protein [Pseudomonadota bacterium]